MTIAFACCAGIAAVVGWSWARGAAADRPVELAMRQPEAGISNVVKASAEPSPAIGKTRSKAKCTGCAVVESVQRIDTSHALMAVCDAGDSTRHRRGGNDFAGRGRDGVESLADTVASVIAGGRGSKRVTANTRHRIVVRFGDGSKQMFDETTPRDLQVGDRILVIAGAGTKSVPEIRTASTGSPSRSVRLRTDGQDATGETAIGASSTARRGSNEV